MIDSAWKDEQQTRGGGVASDLPLFARHFALHFASPGWREQSRPRHLGWLNFERLTTPYIHMTENDDDPGVRSAGIGQHTLPCEVNSPARVCDRRSNKPLQACTGLVPNAERVLYAPKPPLFEARRLSEVTEVRGPGCC